MKSAREIREMMPICIKEQKRKEKIFSQLEEQIEAAAKKNEFSIMIWLSIGDLYKINDDLLELGYRLEDITGCRTIEEWENHAQKYITPEFRPQFDVDEHCYLFPYRIRW